MEPEISDEKITDELPTVKCANCGKEYQLDPSLIQANDRMFYSKCSCGSTRFIKNETVKQLFGIETDKELRELRKRLMEERMPGESGFEPEQNKGPEPSPEPPSPHTEPEFEIPPESEEEEMLLSPEIFRSPQERIIREILRTTKLPSYVKNVVFRWVRLYDRNFTPQHLFQVLSSFPREVPSQLTQLLVSEFNTRLQQEGNQPFSFFNPLPPPPPPLTGIPSNPYNPSQPYSPYQTQLPPIPQKTEEEIREEIRKEFEQKEKEKELKNEIEELKRQIAQLKSSNSPNPENKPQLVPSQPDITTVLTKLKELGLIRDPKEGEKLTREDIERIYDAKIKEQTLQELASALSKLNKRIDQIEGASTPEERVIQQQRLLLENVGETTKDVVSKIIDTMAPIMLRQVSVSQGYAPQMQTYTEDEIEKIATKLEKTTPQS
ncbi:MAG: hypothetical protein ACXQS7_05620 [Candidatus Syntropharchaeia archaeon]